MLKVVNLKPSDVSWVQSMEGQEFGRGQAFTITSLTVVNLSIKRKCQINSHDKVVNLILFGKRM
jgi:hypothetical protein